MYCFGSNVELFTGTDEAPWSQRKGNLSSKTASSGTIAIFILIFILLLAEYKW